MPWKPKRICPRCGKAVSGRCECRPKVEARTREEIHEKNKRYGRRWKAFARGYLTENPLCVDCMGQGRTTAANEVHHVQKVVDAPDRQYEWENVMALCKACHSARTAKGE